MPTVNFIKPELEKAIKKYKKIQDCLAGQEAIKEAETNYLPMPNSDDSSDENSERYEAYLERALFYNVLGRTLEGLLGLIFKVDPKVQIPSAFKSIEENANGAGLSLIQLSRRICEIVIPYSRGGIFTDYPTTGGQTTIAEIEENKARPVLNFYEPWRIINWREKTVGASSLLALVVLQETYIKEDDGFKIAEEMQWRVLRLGPSNENNLPGIINDENIYTVEIWREVDKNFAISESYQPTKADGKYFEKIPFQFVGAKNNDSRIDKPLFIDIANLNIAHYRNSADFEEACFMLGQPTPWASGLTETWVSKVLKGKIMLGSRAFLPLPENAEAGLLQVTENTMVTKAMEIKEKQMVAIGAKLIEEKGVERTATEASIENNAETSILASVANNVSQAIIKSLEFASMYDSRAASEKFLFELNTDFGLAKMTAQERQVLLEEWLQGGMSWSEYREQMRKSKLIYEDDSKVENENKDRILASFNSPTQEDKGFV